MASKKAKLNSTAESHRKVYEALFAGQVVTDLSGHKYRLGTHEGFPYDYLDPADEEWCPTSLSPSLGSNSGIVRLVTRKVEESVVP